MTNNNLTKVQLSVVRRMQAGEVLYFDSIKQRYYFPTSRGYDSVTLTAKVLVKKEIISVVKNSPFFTKPMELTAVGVSI